MKCVIYFMMTQASEIVEADSPLRPTCGFTSQPHTHMNIYI
jgi:hypothetical protein